MEVAYITQEAVARRGIVLTAVVADSARATDIALATIPRVPTVVRCVHRATHDDHTALATMMMEGDFVWAGLVYGERDGSETVGLIETFHVSELERLVERLIGLREVFDAPR